jgi:hypothetical protein
MYLSKAGVYQTGTPFIVLCDVLKELVKIATSFTVFILNFFPWVTKYASGCP